ncbi:MAG: cytochrome [Mucilaginibacter sp.]|uniref:cbb3-type cytochrome c oxidase N-terminal domain-containing protein n=1 Tax=Mucilaginibacter sp. TaxID=1882438 RepID=UPI00262DEF4F|nr:cbb3-type cytochrome c oxidase N-terminal domain-containing protein [Mucilaginibacter sp.]MDB5005537.1 cytochrome [Mucilaginibacter sp.]
MKYQRVILLFALLFTAGPTMAANDSLIPGDLMNYIGYGAVVFMLLLLIIVLLVLLKTTKILTRIILKSEGYTEQEIKKQLAPEKAPAKPKGNVWIKLMSLRPLSEEKDMIMEHEYDGIQELDNPTPAWFMYLFYGTIIFGIGYLLNYHVFHTGQLQYAEYKTEVAQADIAKKAFLSKSANRVDENTVKLVSDPAVISAGQGIFKTNCVACHGDNAQGMVGPNLTDDFWLHGSKINDLFKTIKYGVAAKGMPTWEKILSPKQIADVANYVKSLHGTNPAGAKEPQGTKETDSKLASN